MALDFNKIREKNGITINNNNNATSKLNFGEIRAKNGIQTNTQAELNAYNTLKNATSKTSYVPPTNTPLQTTSPTQETQKWSFYNNVVEPTNTFMNNVVYGTGENLAKATTKYVGGTAYNIGQAVQGKRTLSLDEMQQSTDFAFNNLKNKLNKGDTASNVGYTAGKVAGYILPATAGTQALQGIGVAANVASPLAYGVNSAVQTAANTNDVGDIAVSGATGAAFGALNNGINQVTKNAISNVLPITNTNMVANVLKNVFSGGTGMYGAGAITGEAKNLYNVLRNREVTSEDWKEPVWSDTALSNFVVGSIFGAYTGTKTDLANAEAKLKSDYNSLGTELNQKSLQIKDTLTKGDLATAQRLTQEGNELISSFANTKYLGYKLNENGANMLNQLWQDNVLKSSVLYNPTTIGDGTIQATNIQAQTANLPSTTVAPQQQVQSLPQVQKNNISKLTIEPQLKEQAEQLKTIEQPTENKIYTTEEAIKIGLDNAKLKREYEKVKKLAENNPEQYKQALSDMNKTIDSNNKIINARKKEIKSAKLNTAKEFIKNGTEWKDKKTGIQYSTETAERNIYDVVGNNEEAKEIINTYIKPIYKDTKIITDAKNNYSKSVKELDLNTKEIYDTSDIIDGKIKKAVKDVGYEPQKKLSESSLVQLLGEKIINKKDIEDLGADYNKIQKSVTSIKKIYNDLYEQINNSLVENGYDPVEYTKDYFPHFEEDKPETIIQKIASKLGISTGDDALPTEIAGKTQIFKPGKKWMANLLTRTGNKTYYDAVKGLDRYVNNALEVIHHTKDIQNLRALSNALRYQYSDKAVQERVDEIQNNDSLSDIQKSELIKQEYQTSNSTLSRFNQWLERYTNNLAGKKSDLDREIEYQINRNIYKNFKSIEGRIASNLVGGNISSAFTNFIPITQASAEISPKYLLQGAKDTISNFKNSIEGTNELINNSAFLTNRRGSEAIYEEPGDKIKKALGSLMEGIDNFTSESIVRARFYQNINEGMNEQEALDEADDFTRGLIAGRSTGEMPLIAKASNPLVKLLTSFQLEVNNEYRYFAKDLPRHIKEKLDKEDIKDANKYKTKYISKLTSGIFSAAIFAYLFNNLYEKTFGRRAATDPISIAKNLAEDTKTKGLKTALTNASKDVAEEIPFVGGLIGGGRIPISSAIPSLTNTFSSVLKLYDEEEENNKQAKETLKKELSKPLYYLLPPTGGGQLKKTVEGISTLAKGGEYSYDSSGNKKLNYEIDWESLTPAQKFGKATQSIIAGKSATKEAQNYYKNGGFSASKTEKYEDAKEAGINYDQFVNIYNDLSSIKPKKTNKEGKEEVNTNARKQQIKEYLDDTDLTDEQKRIMYGMFYEVK